MRRPALTRNRLLTSIIAFMVMASLSYNVIAEEKDVWKVIFDFQMKLASQGNPSAQEKVGEMYEEGRGVKQDYDQARSWYSQAAKQGHKGAKDKLLGLNSRIRAKREREQQDSAENREEQERAIARQKAQQQEREAQIKAARLQEARERAARDKAARQQAAQNRARLKQTANKEPKLRKETTGPQQASDKAPLTTSTNRQEEATASKKKTDSLNPDNRIRSNEQQTQINKPEKSTQGAGFKSDPCKSKAARFMSTCKNR